MAKKKRFPSAPSELPLEVCVWEDHSEVEEFSTDIPAWITVGLLIYEDDKQIHLLSSGGWFTEGENLYEDNQMKLHRILKATITKRTPICVINWPEADVKKEPSE